VGERQQREGKEKERKNGRGEKGGEGFNVK